MAGNEIIYFHQHHGPGHASTSGLGFRRTFQLPPQLLASAANRSLPVVAKSTTKSSAPGESTDGVVVGGMTSSADSLTEQPGRANQLPVAESPPNCTGKGASPATTSGLGSRRPSKLLQLLYGANPVVAKPTPKNSAGDITIGDVVVGGISSSADALTEQLGRANQLPVAESPPNCTGEGTSPAATSGFRFPQSSKLLQLLHGANQLPVVAESTPKNSAGDRTTGVVEGGGTTYGLTDLRVHGMEEQLQQLVGANQLPVAESLLHFTGVVEGASPADAHTDLRFNDVRSLINLEQQVSKEIKILSMIANGGKLPDRFVHLQANCFPIKYSLGKTLLQYDVQMKTADGWFGKGSLTKAYRCLLWEKLLSDNPIRFRRDVAVFDGYRVFSSDKLPAEQFKLKYLGGSYIVTIQLVNEYEYSLLNPYDFENSSRDLLQGLDVLMREKMSRNGTYCSVGGCTGFHQSLKFTSAGLALVLDTSELPFCKPMPVIDFLKENVHGFREANDVNRLKRDVEIALKGLKVIVTHRNSNHIFKVKGLTREMTRVLSFTWKDCKADVTPRDVKVVDYFLLKHKKYIVNENIPCLELGKRRAAVPMEFCVIAGGQNYKKKLDNGSSKLLRGISVVPPAVRKNMICEIVRSGFGPCGGQVFQNFGIEVDTNMTRVVARVLKPPTVKLGNGTTAEVDQDKCRWNVLVQKSLLEGVPIDRWALIDFSGGKKKKHKNMRIFIDQLMTQCRSLGVHMEEPLATLYTNMDQLRSFESTREKLEEVIQQATQKKQGQLQIIVCAVGCKGLGYDLLKFVSETEIGVLTQCFLTKKANKDKNDQFLANLALKMNAKVGGRNFELDGWLPGLNKEDPVMLIGAAVNHPTLFNETSRSIAAVVATVNWRGVSRYAARFCSQEPRKEQIVEFGSMCFDLLITYIRINGVKPKKIVVFRDGVSDDQFDMVLNEEFSSLKNAIYDETYKPEITLIVAQKRHHIRVFLENDRKDGCPLNVPPGTVVDLPITGPAQSEFYLCSHFDGIGTSKLTHYEVVKGMDYFFEYDLQELIYHLCFTFARCTGPVSLVPPVYYAHLVAHRARLYHRVSMKLLSCGSPSPSFSGTLSMKKLFKVHSNLKDSMFFV